MSNVFSLNVITNAGAALIAQATAANRIVFVAALSKAAAATDTASLAGQPASWYDGRGGSIVSVSAEGAVARITVAFPATGTRQPLKSVCITARLASQTDAQAVPLAALSDDASTIILPGAGDVGQAVSVPFNIAIDPQQQSVEVTPGASASLADLSRFVSVHKAGDPTAGEAQTILGQKTFSDKLTAAQGLSVLGDLDVLYNAAVLGTVEAMGDVSVSGVATVGGLKGTAPKYDANNTISVPIGGIIGAYSTSAATAGGDLHVYTATQLKTAHWDPGASQYIEGLYYIPAGLYRILVGLKAPGVGEGGLVLLQRLEGEP